jgi:hypothetical protein
MIKELPFSEQSALFARFSNLAYQAPKEATKLFKKAGFEEVTYYGNDGSNAYVIESKDDVVVVCRGTEVKEWNDIISPIKNKDIWFTGHSLGAAMATLMARRCVLDISMRVPTLFTYGSPRVGNRAYINEFNGQITHHRWVNDGDIVTKVPFVPFYYHCGTMHHIGSDGKVTVEFDRKISWKRILSLLLPHGIFKLIAGDAKDHSSELYTENLTFWAMNDVSQS